MKYSVVTFGCRVNQADSLALEAERFNADCTTVFVLSYRLPAEGWANRSLVPLQDAQRAMRLIPRPFWDWVAV